jgi:hypothetical protein
METITNENKKQILGAKSSFQDTTALIDKLKYVSGNDYFDSILNNKTSFVIHFYKYPNGIEIKIAKLFKSFSIGVSFDEIKGISLLKGENNKLRILTKSNNIDFSYKDYDYFDIKDFFAKNLGLSLRIVDNENEFNSTEKITEQEVNQNQSENKDYDISGFDLLIVGYIFATLGGLIGYFIGNHILNSKVILTDNSEKYKYNNSTRIQGRIISIVSITVSGICMIITLIILALK